ncbi:MAG: ferredoxin [Actinomycetota bacterium]|nr:ferredoxin [Actinomycetota bacterium]
MTDPTPLKLTFDAARCDGWGMCTFVFPEGISLDPWGFAHVTPEPVSEPKLQRRARRAAACCPRRAITVVTTPPPPTGAPGERE